MHLGKDANNVNVYQWTKDGSDEQKFKFVYDSSSNSYTIGAYCSSNGNNRVLDIVKSNGSVVKNCNVQIYNPVDAEAQQWKIVPISGGRYRIYPKANANVSLAAYGTANGTSSGTSSTSAGNIYLKANNTSDNSQLWYIVPDYYARHIPNGDYYIRNKNSEKYLDVVNNGTSVGSLICQYHYKGTRNQIWTFKYENGAYRISPKNAPNLCLDISGASSENGALLQLYTSTGTIAQQFRIADSTDTSYRILPRTGNDKKDVVVKSASKDDAASIIQYTHNGTTNENWYIESCHTYTNNEHQNGGYDRTKAKTYAETYALTANPQYLIPQGLDCTNFVSQCLLKGGMTEWVYNNDRTSDRSWYYGTALLGTKYYASYTWGGANNFARHWGKFNGVGVQRAYKTVEYPNAAAMLRDWDNAYENMYNGDIVQFEPASTNNTIGHSVIINNAFAVNNIYNVKDVLYAQHTDPNINASLYAKLEFYKSSNDNRRIIIHRMK